MGFFEQFWLMLEIHLQNVFFFSCQVFSSGGVAVTTAMLKNPGHGL
jgi:hypothetical protein